MKHLGSDISTETSTPAAKGVAQRISITHCQLAMLFTVSQGRRVYHFVNASNQSSRKGSSARRGSSQRSVWSDPRVFIAKLLAVTARFVVKVAAVLVMTADRILRHSFKVLGLQAREAQQLAEELIWQALLQDTGMWDRLSEPETRMYM